MAAGSGSGDQWSSIWGFLLASVGFAVGMGNIWRFPYVLGENGGSAFLIIYLAFAIGIGLPLLITELTIGRRGKSSASGSIRVVAAEAGRSSAWGKVGALGILCAFIILSYYTVISGWTIDYLVKAATGALENVDSEQSTAMLTRMYRMTEGTVPIIGVGGICTARDAYEKIRAGASLVQLYSALTLQGPTLLSEILDGLGELLATDGFESVADAVGAARR